MVDWNHNGERDAFDFAMDMMVMEEMERGSSSKKNTYRSNSSSSDAGDGCFWATMLICFGIIVVCLFILGILMAVADGSIWLLLVLAAILVVLIYLYRKNSTQTSDAIDNTNSNKSSQTEIVQSDTTKENAKSGIEPPKQTVELPRIERMGYYDVAVEHGSITIKKFLGIDDIVQTVPAIINDFPVRIIDTGAYLNCKHIEKVIIAEGIVEICNGAFKGCDKLKEVVIPRSANIIGTDAFPHGKNIVLYCYGGSAGLDFARRYKYEYRDAEDMHPSEVKAEPKTEPKQEQQKVSAQNDSKKKTNYSTGSSSFSYSRNTASHTSNYAAGIAASTLLLDDSDDDDWLNHETARDRLDFELLGTGYDSYDLEWMDEDERDEILWDNGLDPFDYDFDDLDE